MKLIICDVDGTLATSKQPVAPDLQRVLAQLSHHINLGFVTGASFSVCIDQFVRFINPPQWNAHNIHVLPACGTQYFHWSPDGWTGTHFAQLSPDQVQQARTALTLAAKQLGFWYDATYGERIENRGALVTFSAFGQRAPVDIKKAWDPTGEKRDTLAAHTAKLLPNLQVYRGGSTSVDVTLPGMNKGYGVATLCKQLNTSPADALFFGDNLLNGGNDAPVLKTGVKCINVTSPADTLVHLSNLLAEF